MIAVSWVNLFQDIGPCLKARPNGRAIFPSHFLTDHGAAGATRTAEESQLECCAGQSLAGNTIVFLYDNGIEWCILEGDSLRLAAMEDDLLCGGLLHLEPGCRLDLRNGVLARVQAFALLMELNLTILISEDLAIVDGLRSVRSFASGCVRNMKTRPLDGSAGNGVFLIDGQFRRFAVFEDQLLLITGIQADYLLAVSVLIRQVVRCRDGGLNDPVGARLHT